jgi:hypothetical protein
MRGIVTGAEKFKVCYPFSKFYEPIISGERAFRLKDGIVTAEGDISGYEEKGLELLPGRAGIPNTRHINSGVSDYPYVRWPYSDVLPNTGMSRSEQTFVAQFPFCPHTQKSTTLSDAWVPAMKVCDADIQCQSGICLVDNSRGTCIGTTKVTDTWF